MQLTHVTFIGTADEFAAVQHLFTVPQGAQPVDTTTTALVPPTKSMPEAPLEPAPTTDDTPIADVPVTAPDEIITQVLQQPDLPPRVLQLLNILNDAGDEPRSRAQIAEAMALTQDQINGVLGTLGRRIRATPGIQLGDAVPLRLFLDVTQQDGTPVYRLQPQARRMLERVGAGGPA